jgi:hypothetical protein
MGMLFEEGLPPEDAAGIFERPLKTRILSEYHDRLGGAWTPRGSKPVALWIRDLLELRHRVAHSGHTPTYDEALAAREAFFALGTHLRDRLAIRAKQYPFTVGMPVTRGGFDRRDIHTKAAEAAISLANSEKLPVFVRWRAEVMRKRP